MTGQPARRAFASAIGTLQSALDGVLAVVLAPGCAACGALLPQPTRGPVCADCWRSILPLTPPLCLRCGDPLPAWRVSATASQNCPRCRRRHPAIDRAQAIGEYDGALRAIIHALKYGGRRSLARPLGALMRQRGAGILAGAACAIPVPLHASRRRHRGFNQAADLARHVGLPVCAALVRRRATATQTGLAAAQRHRNVRDAFAPTRAGRALGAVIVVLIDDVSTTGATLESCARALKAVGVAEVRALTAAKVVTTRR
ncbi:MAG TPA: ComF family protein [Vicinamibacterales bacterium]|jgi:ComF family protein|nr:ComF family protein [Vicinamibacterales bacterium]